MSDVQEPSLSPEEFAAAIASLSSPKVVRSPFGDLNFFDGVPLPETDARAYDALDLMRGIEVFLNTVPGASLVALRRGVRRAGTAHTISISGPRLANAGRAIGWRRYRVGHGSRSSGCMDRSSRGSIRAGGSTSSSPSGDGADS